jgi:hypothetical protein
MTRDPRKRHADAIRLAGQKSGEDAWTLRAKKDPVEELEFQKVLVTHHRTAMMEAESRVKFIEERLI